MVAVLLEALKAAHGNPVIVLGRSRPEDASDEIVTMSDEAFAAYATDFYRTERARDPAVTMPTLRARYETLASSREVARTLLRLRAQPGRVVYRVADLVDADAVHRAVTSACAEIGAPGLVIHGAGVQFSGSLSEKRLENFRKTILTKLGGLEAVLHACNEVSPAHPPHVHVLGSAFSFFGNDGQHDYGAANETLHRLARARPEWSGIGWPGWRSIGMTRGSEYAGLARARGLRPLPAHEGKNVFLDMLASTRRLVMPVSAGEIAWSGTRLYPALLGEYSISPDAHPLVGEHLVKGQPALPATFIVELVVRALQMKSPGWFVTGGRDVRFPRFARLSRTTPGTFRVLGTTVSGDSEKRRIRVRLVSDFRHANGKILRRDVEHLSGEFEIRRIAAPLAPFLPPTSIGDATTIADSYCSPTSLVRLEGAFASVHDIEIGARGQRARFRVPTASALTQITTHSLPALLADATCRVAMYGLHAGKNLVPVRVGSLSFEAGSNDAQIADRGGVVTIQAAPSRQWGEHTISDWAVARDGQGRTLVRLEGLSGWSLGDGDNETDIASSDANPAAFSPKRRGQPEPIGTDSSSRND